LTGWKTWVAAIGGMAAGVAKMASSAVSDPLDANGVYEGFIIFLAGLAALGIGHKIEKASK